MATTRICGLWKTLKLGHGPACGLVCFGPSGGHGGPWGEASRRQAYGWFRASNLKGCRAGGLSEPWPEGAPPRSTFNNILSGPRLLLMRPAYNWASLYDPTPMILSRSRDIHPRPRPLHVGSVNVTSLTRHWRQVMTSRADVVCMQEKRLTVAG